VSVWQLGAHDFKGNDRFDVRRRIGEGGMGVVYEAFDRERETEVALKMLLRMSPGAIYRIKKEFRALADVNHPNLVTLHELVSNGDQWFFTMELVEGVNFLQYVRPGLVSEARTEDQTIPTLTEGLAVTRTLPEGELSTGQEDLLTKVAVGDTDAEALPPLDYDRLRHALKELAEGLVALHDAGKLHRDIKPSNVMVTPRGRIVLLDFGLATDVDEDSLAQSAMGSVVGTVAYMAPEQASGEGVGPASDWYATGTMLYQALTGKLPFTGTLYKVIFEKQQKDPTPVRELAPDAPKDLADLCHALIQRDPKARLEGRQILDKLGGLPPALATPALAFAVPDLSPQFIGRKEHLELLADAFDSCLQDRSVIVHVRGTSGIGKTALVRQFLERLEETKHAYVFAGRCYERELVPYKALDNLIDGMSRHLRRLSYAEAAGILPEGIEALARLFPVLNRVDAIHHRSAQVKGTPDPIHVRSRAFAAFRELLRAIGRTRPPVLCLDDLQWGDADSARLIEELLRQPGAPRLMLIAVYRTEDRDASELVRVLRMTAEHPGTDVRDLLVGPLEEDDARSLARAIIGKIGERVTTSGRFLAPIAVEERTEEIVRESQGSPLFIYELAVHAQHSDSTEVKPTGPMEEADTSESISLREVLRSRLSHLPSAARELLEIVAVAGRPLRLEAANTAANLDPKERSLAALLTSNHLARTRNANGVDEIETYHDRIRTSVVESMDIATLRHRRRALAQTLAEDRGTDPEELVLALKEAGHNDQAAEAAKRAAERSLGATAFYQAASLYGLALDLSSDSEDRWDLRAKWADALAQAGRGEEAAEAYLKAAERAPKDRRIDLLRRAAEQFLRFGKATRGIEILREVLAHFGMDYPDQNEDAYQTLRLIRSRLLLRGLSFHERDAHAIPPGTLERVDACWSAGVGLTMVDVIRSSIFTSSFLHLALDAGDPNRVARALAMELALLTSQGDRSPNRVKRVLTTLGELATRIDDPYVQGFAAMGEAFAAWHSGNWQDCAEKSDRAKLILRERASGVDWELDTAGTFQLWSESYRGNFTGLRERLDGMVQDAKTRRDLYAATLLRTSANATIVWLADDDLAAATRHIDDAAADSAQAGFHLQHFWELSSRVAFDLYAGDGASAHARLAEQWPALEESMFMRVQVIRAEARYLRARCALAVSDLEAARKDADALEKEAMPYAITLGQMVRARALEKMGMLTEAASLYERAAKSALTSDMAIHGLVAHRRRAKLIPHDGSAIQKEVDRRLIERAVKNPKAFAALIAP
jgi:eukaryotic-like serine/threonine-protein kinase